MRVLFLLHQFLPRHVTGTEQFARSLALDLRRRGHDVRVFAYEPLIQFAAPGRLWFEDDGEVDGIPIHRISVHPLASPNPVLIEHDNPLAVRLFERWLDGGERFDLVHVFHPRYLGCGGLDALVRRQLPFVVHLMDFYYLCANYMLLRRGDNCDGPPEGGLGCVGCIDPELGGLLARTDTREHLRRLVDAGADGVVGLGSPPIDRAHALVARPRRLLAALGRASAVLAPSRFLQAMYERNGYAGPPIRHVPYGVDPGRFEVAAAPRPEASPPAELRLGYVGSITPHKGLHTVLPVLRQLDGARGWRLDVHGDLATHPEYGERVRELAGDDDRIRFHGAFASARLGEVLATLDALVVPSLWYENTPFVVLEALWFGLPVIATDLGGIAEVVEHGRNGLLFRPGDDDGLAGAVRRLLDDPALAARLGADPGKPRTLAACVDELLAIYAEVTAAAAPSG